MRLIHSGSFDQSVQFRYSVIQRFFWSVFGSTKNVLIKKYIFSEILRIVLFILSITKLPTFCFVTLAT